MKHESMLPLTESTYLIMLSLLEKRHGYGIILRVQELSGNKIGSGTLYGVIRNLDSKKLIRTENGDNNQKLYCLNNDGIKVLQLEISRLKKMVALGEKEVTNERT